MSDDNMTAVPDVGAQDPELKNSPIADESDEEFDVIRQEIDGVEQCYFNSVAFDNEDFVQSGTGLLRCDRGLWTPAGSTDPDNP